MTKFKTTIGKVDKGATAGAQPQAEPQEEAPKIKERKPIHPGLTIQSRCLKCATFLTFHDVSSSDVYVPLAAPFGTMAMAFCECGIWTRDQNGRIRWIRYSSGLVRPGEGEVFAP